MNILIIHTAFIGDIVLSTPLISKINKKYPNSNIYYLTTPAGAEILANNPLIKEIIVYDKKGKDKSLSGFFRIIKLIKSYNFYSAYIPHRYLRSRLIAFLGKIPQRIGYDINFSKIFLNKKVEYLTSRHEVDRLLNLVDCDNFTDKEIHLYPNEENKRKIDKIWKDNGIKNKKTLVIAPGSVWFTKKWPYDYWLELLDMFKNKENIQIILVGAKKDNDERFNKYTNIINLIGKTNLLDLAELLRQSDLLIGNDSSPIHIASAFNTRIIAIFGATVPSLGFSPWSKNSIVMENNDITCRPCSIHGGNKCPKEHFKCMKEVKPQIVYSRIIEILG